MSTREFIVCLTGLTLESRWLQAYRAQPIRADTPEAISSLFGSYNGQEAISDVGDDGW